MNVLFVASEGVPFIKTGGLADVIGALPKALKRHVNVQVMLPLYGDIPWGFREMMEDAASFDVTVGWRNQSCSLKKCTFEGITYYFIDNEYYFKRHGSYGFYDDGERFSFYCHAVLAALLHLDDRPDILHCHDWQTGMISVLKKAHYRHHPFYEGMKTVFTIHNLRYQGIFPKDILSDLLDLSELYFNVDGVEYNGNVSFMKAGLVFSDVITTVSPTYAEEITTPYFGEGLDGVLRKRSSELTGIVNGIDTELYDPATDPHLFMTFTNEFERKMENKTALQERLGLPVNPHLPMIAVVGRLVEQKGIDLILGVLQQLLSMDIQLVVLGTGEEHYEQAFQEAAWFHPEKVSVHITFNDGFARQIYAASDMFLMPSQFEPCGISQLLALRYGSLPIVRETGGLKDTVRPYNEFTHEGHGFSFASYNAHDMLYTIQRAVSFYKYRPELWSQLVKRASDLDFSWERSSGQYADLYHTLVR